MDYNFRHRAQEALIRAKKEIHSNDIHRIKYAALELRFCIEALTYDRAKLFYEDLSDSDFEVWQPTKLFQTILEIEPLADMSGELRFQDLDENSNNYNEWISLGSENFFNLNKVKKSYSALGNFLHEKTLKNIKLEGSSEDKNEKIKNKCLTIIEELEAAINSPIYNVNIKSHVKLKCLVCNNIIIKRVKLNGEDTIVDCSCKASYFLKYEKNNDGFIATRRGYKVKCIKTSCSGKNFVPYESFKQGYSFTCQNCQEVYEISLGLIEKKDR